MERTGDVTKSYDLRTFESTNVVLYMSINMRQPSHVTHTMAAKIALFTLNREQSTEPHFKRSPDTIDAEWGRIP